MFKHPARTLIEELATCLAAVRSKANRTRDLNLIEEYHNALHNYRRLIVAYNLRKPFWRRKIKNDTRLRLIDPEIG
jgi:hypothetical protein